MYLIKRYWILFTSAFLLLYLLLFSLYGFDLTDEGYVLYTYQNIFKDPQSVDYGFGVYLTCVFGGIWDVLFGAGGWYAFRILNAIIIVAAYTSLCLLLKKYWHYKWLVFMSFFIVILNMNVAHGTLVFHYYSFSGFTNTLIGCLLCVAFAKRNYTLLFIASVLLGMNIFVRIPNLTLCLIPYLTAFIVYVYDKNISILRYYTIIASIGLCIGILLVIAFIFYEDHDFLILNKLNELSGIARDSSHSHGILPMIKISVIQYLFVLVYMAVIFIFYKGFHFLYQKYKNGQPIYLLFLVIATYCSIAFLYYGLPTVVQPMFPRMTFLLAIVYSMAVYFIWNNLQNKEAVCYISVFFLISVLQPLGSDLSIGNMGPYSIWGMIPVAFVLFTSCISKLGKKDSLILRHATYATLVVCFFSFGKSVYHYCYRDEGDRFEKTYRIKNSSLATVFTSEEQGAEIDSLLNECSKYVKEDNVILFPLDMPGLYYLTRTVPALNNPWPILLGEEQFHSRIIKFLGQKHHVVVERDPIVLNSANLQFYQSRASALHDFIIKENYKLVWASKNYRIYK